MAGTAGVADWETLAEAGVRGREPEAGVTGIVEREMDAAGANGCDTEVGVAGIAGTAGVAR